MAIKQTRIFVPSIAPYDDSSWAETALGQVVQPLIKPNNSLRWFWFSRYLQGREPSSGDADISKIPSHFQLASGDYKSLMFRFEISDNEVSVFENTGNEIVNQKGCCLSDWRDYDIKGDLGGNRFVGEDRSDERRAERAYLMAHYLHSVSKLVLHSLIGPDTDGRFRIESNYSMDQNPLGSSFESMHHMFCNITEVPLSVQLFRRGSDIHVGTDWYPPDPSRQIGNIYFVRF